ncbi:MAG TPA: hypothetical protein VF178_11780 [Gemmatimonadaceae bacterium]
MDRVHRFRLSLTLLAAAALALPAGAQQTQPSGQGLPIVSGTRVRVTATGLVTPLVANYLELRGDTLFVFEDGTGRGIWSFALDRVQRLEATAGERGLHRPYMLRGAVIGGGVGLIGGLVFAAAASPSDPSEEYDKALTSLVGLAVGAGVGAFIGSRFTTEAWVPVPLPRRTAGGYGLSLGFRLRY